MRLLATTALEETWGSGEPLLFLGEWCRRYARRAAWESREHRVVPYHWDDREKLRRDCDSLKEAHDRLLGELASFLNRVHGLERPARYWRMILDPWLLSYVAAVWDRWECVRLAFEGEGPLKVLSSGPSRDSGPFRDYDDFIARVLDDPWNERLCLEIILARHADRCVVEAAPAPAPAPAPRPRPAPLRASARRGLEALADALLGLWPARERIVFFMSYFPPVALARLSWSVGQAPRWYVREFRRPAAFAASADRAARAGAGLALAPRDDFEAFLFRRILADLPEAYWEHFGELRARAERVPMRPRVILSAVAHWGHELFKAWSAERVHGGAKFVSMAHGGGLPRRFGFMSFEEDVADAKVVWTVPCHPKHVRLPPAKLAERTFRSTREILAVIGNEMPRYAYRAHAAPIAGQVLAGWEQVCAFREGLAGGAGDAFRVRPYPNRGWDTAARWRDRLGAASVSDGGTYDAFLGRARMIVCTYPETTFSEAMATGLPVILLYPSRLWETIPEMEPLLRLLRDAGILFDDAAAAAAHVNAVWDAPERWWEGAGPARAREEFRRLAADPGVDWLGPWTAFLRETAR